LRAGSLVFTELEEVLAGFKFGDWMTLEVLTPQSSIYAFST
jgi:hypothetical protein